MKHGNAPWSRPLRLCPLAGGDYAAAAWRSFSGEAAHFGFELLKLGEAAAAQTVFEHLCVLDPTSPDRAQDLEELSWRRGNLAAAWPMTRAVGCQWRCQLDRHRFRNVPPWVPGEDLHGRTLLIVPDSGLGDMLWHYRYSTGRDRMGEGSSAVVGWKVRGLDMTAAY